MGIGVNWTHPSLVAVLSDNVTLLVIGIPRGKPLSAPHIGSCWNVNTKLPPQSVLSQPRLSTDCIALLQPKYCVYGVAVSVCLTSFSVQNNRIHSHTVE